MTTTPTETKTKTKTKSKNQELAAALRKLADDLVACKLTVESYTFHFPTKRDRKKEQEACDGWPYHKYTGHRHFTLSFHVFKPEEEDTDDSDVG